MYRQALKILNNGQRYTVEQLAAELAINIAELQTILANLVAYGIKLNNPITNVYQLLEPVELLDIEIIRAKLTTVDVKFFDVIDSTNKYALAANYIDQPLACLAEYQTAGRGRQGHDWISPYASGLCLSIKYDYADCSKLEGLSIALAVTIVRVLYNLGITEIGLKWPNDILWRQRKLAGLLLESRYGKKYEVVVGVGINVTMPITDKISQPWVDLTTILAQPPTRSSLAVDIIDNCLPTLLNYPAIGLKPFLSDWQYFDLSYKKLVTLHTSNKSICGIATGIDERGALQINGQSYLDGSLQLV